jgi:hypothetical protein
MDNKAKERKKKGEKALSMENITLGTNRRIKRHTFLQTIASSWRNRKSSSACIHGNLRIVEE